jgi:hypothetical protein
MSHFVKVKSSYFRNLSALIEGTEGPRRPPAEFRCAGARSAWDNALWPPPRLAIEP